MKVSPQRRRMLLALPGALAGCISVDVGTGTSAAHTRYVLEDPSRKDPARQATAPAASPLIPALVVQSLGADPLADSTAIVYSRAEHERSTYALSSWTDRPSRRIAWLLRRRLEDAGTFGAVVALGQPVRTPWLLSVTIVSAYHDVRSEPGRGVVALTAVLLDQHARRQQARREFREEEPAAEANAAAATAAIGRATARVFDALVPWLEAELRRTMAGARPAVAADLAVVGARIYPAPDAPPIERGTLLLRDGRIAAVGPTETVAVPAGTTVIDAAGTCVTAGFWNSHVHIMPPTLSGVGTRPAPELQAVLNAMLTRWGFTTVFDVASVNGSARALRQRIESGEIAGPSILTVDAPFFPKDATPIYVRALLKQMGNPSAEVADPDQARARATQQIAAGADGVKLFTGAIVGGPVQVVPMDVTIARAAVEEAHRHGKPAFAHPSNLAGLEVAMAAGVDVLAHTAPFSGPWDDALVKRLRAANLALVPTLTLFEAELRKESVPDQVIERFLADATQQVRVFAAAGGTILFGTDVGYIDHFDTRREFELMARAGLDWRQILASLTTAPAARFGQGQRKGRIAVGMEADLVLLRTDPAVDVSSFSDVQATIRGGRLIHSSAANK